jgi:uncharacterized protein with HEPN domain
LSRDKDALLDILERIELIQRHGTADEQSLTDDVVVQAATLHWIEIIGEAANRISTALKEQHPEVPSRAVIAMRNLVTHGYDQVRLDIVWEVIRDDLEPLREQIGRIAEDVE